MKKILGLILVCTIILFSGCSFLAGLMDAKITFDGNGNTTGDMPDQIIGYGDPINICKFEIEGYNFIGWAKSPWGDVEFPDGDTYVANADVTLYAKWEEDGEAGGKDEDLEIEDDVDEKIEENQGGNEGGNEDSNSILASARSYIGTKYLTGGKSTNQGGLDCSGFVSLAFSGVDLPVYGNSASMINCGYWIQYGTFEPGDLLFFDADKNNVIDHVAIYTGEDEYGIGYFIHSVDKNKDGGVIEEPFKQWYHDRYFTARRVEGVMASIQAYSNAIIN